MAITEIELAEKVKSKYPQYKDIDDTELVSLVLDRYPEYSTQLGEKEYSKNLLTNSAKTLVSGGVQAAINAGAGMTQSYSMLLGDKSDTSEEAVEEYASQRRVKQRKGGSRMAKGKILAHRKRKNEVIQSLNENSHRLRTVANGVDEQFNIDPEFANSFGGQVLKGFGQMIGNIGAAVVGTAVAGPLGGVAASVGTIAPQMVSEAVSDSEATLGKSYMDMTEEEKDQVALATAGYATLGTALEFAPVARIPWVKNFLRGKTKVPAGLLKSPSVRREIAKGFAAEGFTEAAQGQLLDSLARATFDDDRELMSWDVLRQRFNEFAVGGVVGGGTSGGIATVQKAARGELFKPKETKEVQTDGTKKEVFEVTYTDQNTGQPVSIEIDAESQEEATRIAGERLTELASEGTIVARPQPKSEPVTEEVVAEEVVPEAEQAELQEELQEDITAGASVTFMPRRFVGEGAETAPGFFQQFSPQQYDDGRFINVETKEDLSDETFEGGSIRIEQGRPVLETSDNPSDTIIDKKASEEGSLVRTNLFKQKAGWKWTEAPEGEPSTIVSVEQGSKHFYTLDFTSSKPLTLKTYPDKKSEPRGRPTTRGKVQLGKIVGEIDIRGKKHPVYDQVTVGEPEVTAGAAPVATPQISEVSDANDTLRVGTAKLGTKARPVTTENTSNIDSSIVPDDILQRQMDSVDYDHLPDDILNEKDPKVKYEKLVTYIEENLLALHDSFPEELRARATQWYDGANKIANDLANRYNLNPEQVAGVMAVLSPQKDWFMNVAQAEQVIHTFINYQNFEISGDAINQTIQEIIDAAEAPIARKRKSKKGETKEEIQARKDYNKSIDQKAKDDRAAIINGIRGKTINELNQDKSDEGQILTGWAIRIISQTEYGRYYNILSPEGNALGPQVKLDGTPSLNTWGSIREITKSISIIENGSIDNISEQLGNKHKVRNFFNNIVAPNSPQGDVTIDTHAVAAGLLMPLGASAVQVHHNFGGRRIANKPGQGINGTYHIFLEAYRRAAAKRGVQPRQMQSITWEAVRKLFLPSDRTKSNIDNITKKWKNSNNNDQGRQQIIGGKVLRPDWSGDSGRPEVVTENLPKAGSQNVLGGDLQFRGRTLGRDTAEVTAQAAPVEPGDTTDIRSVVRDAMKIRVINRYFTETLVEDGVYETGSLEEINEKVSDFALLKEAEYLLDFADTPQEKGKVQSLIDTLKAIRAEDTRPRTKIDEEIEAFAPFGKSITSRQELRDFVFSFSPIAEKLGFKIKPRRSGHEARFSSNNNAVEIVFPKLYRRISESLDLQGGGRKTGTGFVTALMREEIIHGTMNQVLIKKGIKDTLAWYEQLGRDLTQAQRDEVNDIYGIEVGYKGQEDFGYGTEFARMIIQRGLYGNVTEAFTTSNKGTAYDKMVALLKSVQAYITKALKGEVTTNPEAAGVIMEAARLLQSVDPEARLVNQKVVNDSLAFSVDVSPNAEVTSEQVAESGKPPSEKKLNINFARKYLLTVSSLLNSIHPRLKKLVRDYYGAIQGEVLDYQKRVAPFFKKYRGIKNAEDRKRLKQLLSYSPVEQEGVDPLIEERDALLRKYDLFNDYQLEIRPVLNELYNRLGNEGIMIGFLEQYFPRSIKDLDKVKNRAGKELRDAFREFIKARNERIEEARTRIEAGNPRPGDVELSKETTIQIGNEKTAALEAQQWDQFTRGFNSEGRRNLPGNFLSRTEELNVIPENLLDAYEDPGAAMERYIYNAVTAIQTTRLMGSKFANVPEGLKVPPASELGLLIQELRANGEISMEDADGTVPDIFAMILSPMQVENMFFQLARTFGYGTLLVEFTSTLSQLYDLPFIMLDNGIFGTAVAMFGPRLKGDDFGIDTQQVSAEFASDNRVLEKAVRVGLRATGFTKLDQVMKETNLTANYNRYRKLARGYFKDRNSANSKKFVAELTSMGYSEQEQTQLIADLKKGDRDSAYIRTLLFNKLSETQPLTKAEMALGIVGNPNLRFTVAMKSFMIKQLNFVRDRMINEFIDGVRTGDAKKIRKASNDMALLMTFMLLIGLPVDALKDFLAGRLGYMSDYLFNGVFRIAGVSRYTAYQARKEGVGQAAFDYVTPVAIQQFVDMTSEVGRVARGERAITESKFVTLLPFSDVINRIFGFQKGRERKEYMRRVREGERPFIVPPGAL
jgi:hypothetical protein